MSRPCISLGGLNCQKSSYNKKLEFQFNEEPAMHTYRNSQNVVRYPRHTDTNLHGRVHMVPPHPIWRSTVHTENDRFRDHGQILPTLRRLHPQNSESKIRQSIFLAGEITSIQKKFFQLNIIPNIMFPLILGLREA